MIKVGERVTVHTFGLSGRTGTVIGVTPSEASVNYPNVRTVAMVTVSVDGRMTWNGPEDDHTAYVPATCVKVI